MSDENHGPSSAELHASGAMGNPRASSGMGVGGGSGMLPFGSQPIEMSLGSVDTIVHLENADSMLASITAGGGAFGQTINDSVGAIANHLGASEAKGDQGLKLESLGQGERVAPPTAQAELQLKSLNAKPSAEEGASH